MGSSSGFATCSVHQITFQNKHLLKTNKLFKLVWRPCDVVKMYLHCLLYAYHFDLFTSLICFTYV